MSKDIIDTLDLPKEIIYSLPTIYMKGNLEMIVENHRGISYYDDKRIQIMTKNYLIVVLGKALNITEFNRDIIKLNGTIYEVSFE